MLTKHIPYPLLEAECSSQPWLWVGRGQFYGLGTATEGSSHPQQHNISNKDLPCRDQHIQFFLVDLNSSTCQYPMHFSSSIPSPLHGKASCHLRAQALILVQTSNAVNSNPCFINHSKNSPVQEFTEWLPVIVSFSAHLLPLANRELLATLRFQTASLIKGPRSPPHKPTETKKEWKMCAPWYCKICTFVFLCLAGSSTVEYGKYFLFIYKVLV